MGKQLNTDLFKKKMQEIDPNFFNEYILVGEYKNRKTPISFIHEKCGNSIDITPDSLFNGSRCSYCKGNHRLTIEIIKTRVEKIPGYEFIKMKSSHVSSKEKMIVRHISCSHTFETYPYNFFSGHLCPFCNYGSSNTAALSFEEAIKKRGYFLIGNYSGRNNLVELKHEKCGNTFFKNAGHFKNSGECPFCISGRKSKGETEIKKFLLKNKIQFVSEKTFSDLKDISLLKFDFYIEDKNTVIEYDGIQHYEDTWHKPDKYELTKKHDIMKNEYCKSHNINMIRIPYWDFKNINMILDENFKIIQKKLNFLK